jgi:hypothetical protein
MLDIIVQEVLQFLILPMQFVLLEHIVSMAQFFLRIVELEPIIIYWVSLHALFVQLDSIVLIIQLHINHNFVPLVTTVR